MSEMFPSDLPSLLPKQPAKDMVVIINARNIAWFVRFMKHVEFRWPLIILPSEFNTNFEVIYKGSPCARIRIHG